MLKLHDGGPVTRATVARTAFGRPLFTVQVYVVDGWLIDCGPPATGAEMVHWARDRNLRGAVNTHQHEDHASLLEPNEVGSGKGFNMERIMTIERHIIEQQREHPGATGVFSNLLYDVALAAKLIARETTRAGLVEILGLAGRINVQGEAQMKLDVFAHETMVRMNSFTGRLAAMVSEEDGNIIPIPSEYAVGKYVMIFDPLDGSSNIDVNVSIGTIFGIYRRLTEHGPGALQDFLQPGRKLEAAGYVIYGPSTMMVYSTGNGVHGFTLDLSVGEFLLSHPNLCFPTKPKYYSVNQGYQKYWSEGVQRYTRWLQGLDSEQPRKELSARYIGSLVADFHRNLLEGGVYYYPADSKDPKLLHGKLRLMVEAIPLSFLAEQAGGRGSDGRRNILDIQPESLHQRTPLFIGQRELVEKAEEYIRRYDDQ